MRFFSGFSLKNEAYLFDKYIRKSDYTVCGFSYGAIKAYEYVSEQLRLGKRVDSLQLFSPAFFQSRDEKFKRLQLSAYQRNEDAYMEQFVSSCFFPYEKKILEHKETSREELKELLYYEWSLSGLRKIEDRGVKIEVYLGGEDKIIDVHGGRELFLQVATVSYIKSANHFLQIN